MDYYIDIILYVSYGLVIVAAAAAIIFPVINSFSNPASLIKSGIGLVALAAIFVLSWVIAGSDFTSVQAEESGMTASLAKLVGGVLITMYMLIGVAIVGIVFTEISKMIK